MNIKKSAIRFAANRLQTTKSGKKAMKTVKRAGFLAGGALAVYLLAAEGKRQHENAKEQ